MSLQRPCTKCGGIGRIEQFKHVENGECFECGGSGVAFSLEEAGLAPVIKHRKPREHSRSFTLRLGEERMTFTSRTDGSVIVRTYQGEQLTRTWEPMAPIARKRWKQLKEAGWEQD